MDEVSIGKSGKAASLLLLLDAIGFALLFIGAALVRYAKDEFLAILGGFVLAGGVAILSATRLIPK